MAILLNLVKCCLCIMVRSNVVVYIEVYGRIYRVYEFRLGNNVLVSLQLVFASRELVTKNAAPVSDLHLVSIIACTRSRR